MALLASPDVGIHRVALLKNYSRASLGLFTMAKKVTGGCACGSIRYQLLDKPMFVHCCHCEDCQRLTGSAFVLNAIIETRAIKLTRGTPVAVPVPQWERGLIPIWDAVNVPCVPPMTDVMLPRLDTAPEAAVM